MIREARIEDMSRMVEIAHSMHNESRYSVLSFNEEKMAGFLGHAIKDQNYLLLVAEQNGKLIGGFVGAVYQMYFSDDYVASDFVVFIEPEHRGGLSAIRMIKQYQSWAISKGAKIVQLGISTGVKVEETSKLYESLGYNSYGKLFELRGERQCVTH